MPPAAELLPPGVSVFERGWLSSNNVLVIGPDSAGLVDSGYASHADQTIGLVCSALGSRPLDTLVNTHLHSDHCGGNAALQARYAGLQTLIPPGLAEAVRRWDPVALTYVPTGQQCPRFHVDGLARPGSPIELGGLTWKIHAAPGHDPNSVILFQPGSGLLLSADALWENGFGVVFPELEGDRAFDEVAATLDLIESLHPKVVVPGHGSMFHDVAGALGRARSRLDAYSANPVKHAAHAAKVLMKFKLLELQRLPYAEFSAWAQGTPYFQLVQQRWFPEADLVGWISTLFADLVRSGAAKREGEFAANA